MSELEDYEDLNNIHLSESPIPKLKPSCVPALNLTSEPQVSKKPDSVQKSKKKSHHMSWAQEVLIRKKARNKIESLQMQNFETFDQKEIKRHFSVDELLGMAESTWQKPKLTQFFNAKRWLNEHRQPKQVKKHLKEISESLAKCEQSEGKLSLKLIEKAMLEPLQDFIKIVQRRNIKINTVLNEKWNLLLLSAKCDKLEVFHYLTSRELKESPNPPHLIEALNQVPSSNTNILHLCILHSSLDFLKALTQLMISLDSQSNFSFAAHLEFPTKARLTPFLTAVIQSKSAHVRHLAELGCNIWAKSENLENALHFAFKNKSAELIKLLSFLDADNDKLRSQIDLKKRKPSDLDPTKQLVKCLRHPWELVKMGKSEVLSKKIQAGRLDINIATFKKKNTLLHLAVKYHQTAIAKLLIENGALKDLKNYKNLTALQIATIKGDKIYSSLIEGIFNSHSLYSCNSETLKPQNELKTLHSQLNKKQKSLHSIKIILPALKPNVESMSKFLF